MTDENLPGFAITARDFRSGPEAVKARVRPLLPWGKPTSPKGNGGAKPKPGPVIPSGAQVARLVAGSLQALGPAAPMAFTRNQYCVPLVRPVTVHFDDLPT
jgi:hypothetical protein